MTDLSMYFQGKYVRILIYCYITSYMLIVFLYYIYHKLKGIEDIGDLNLDE